jgi:hypothetical protein
LTKAFAWGVLKWLMMNTTGKGPKLASHSPLACVVSISSLWSWPRRMRCRTSSLRRRSNALQNQRIASLTERSNEYAGRLDDAARAHNELQDTINQIRQRNADLTIDQGAIDVLMRAHDFAMCPSVISGIELLSASPACTLPALIDMSRRPGFLPTFFRKIRGVEIKCMSSLLSHGRQL